MMVIDGKVANEVFTVDLSIANREGWSYLMVVTIPRLGKY